MRILASIVAAGLFAFSLAAHADTIVTFDVSGLFHVDSAILSGNFTMDTTTGIITSVDMFVGAPDSFTLNGIYEQGCTSGTGGANCVVTFDTNGTGFATYPIVNLRDSLGMLANYSTNGAVHFVCMDWRHMGETLAAGAKVDDTLLNLCVWAKDNGGLGSFYRSRHELVFAFRKGKGRYAFAGLRAGLTLVKTSLSADREDPTLTRKKLLRFRDSV